MDSPFPWDSTTAAAGSNSRTLPILLSILDRFAGLVPNQIPFPGRISFAQETQAGQLDPSQPQTPPQTQQGPNNVSQPLPSCYSEKR